MALYSEDDIALLHEKSDSIVQLYNLKGRQLDHFANGVSLIEYALRRGNNIRDQFEHIRTFDGVSKAIEPLDTLKQLMVGE